MSSTLAASVPLFAGFLVLSCLCTHCEMQHCIFGLAVFGRSVILLISASLFVIQQPIIGCGSWPGVALAQWRRSFIVLVWLVGWLTRACFLPFDTCALGPHWPENKRPSGCRSNAVSLSFENVTNFKTHLPLKNNKHFSGVCVCVKNCPRSPSWTVLVNFVE